MEDQLGRQQRQNGQASGKKDHFLKRVKTSSDKLIFSQALILLFVTVVVASTALEPAPFGLDDGKTSRRCDNFKLMCCADIPAYSDTLGTRQKCHCKQVSL